MKTRLHPVIEALGRARHSVRAALGQTRNGTAEVTRPTTVALLLGFFILHSAFILSASAQTTAFTYQGALNDSGSPANGSFDLHFALYDALTNGGQQGVTLTNAAIAMSNGLFSVTLDFGSQFPGADRWLEIGVRTNGGGSFTTLAPRQQVTSTPYAIRARHFSGTISNAQLSGNYTGPVTFSNGSNVFSGTFSGNGAGLTNLNVWQIGGNAGTTPGVNFLGTTDNQAIEVKVNSQRALRIQPTAAGGPNLTGGSSANYINPSRVGATIGGGGAVSYLGGPTISNWVTGDFGTVSGGWSNSARSVSATVGGGFANSARAIESTIAGGIENDVGGTQSAIGGGKGNAAGGDNAFVGGGQANAAGGTFAVVAGGRANTVSGQFSAIAGGDNNLVNAYYATVGGGQNNTNAGNGGLAGDFGVIAGGRLNTIQFQARYAVIPGGLSNYVSATNAFAAGQRARAIHNGTFVWADDTAADFSSTTNQQFAIRANNGVLVQATNTALDLRGGGAIRVEGAGIGSSTAVFIHRAIGANISANSTLIDHPHANNDSNALLIVTQNWNPGGAGGVYNNHPIGVSFTAGKWRIFNEDLAAMPTNAAFNVLVMKP